MYNGRFVDIPCGRGGLNTNQNVYQVPPTDLITARNIRFDGYSWIKAPGLSLFDSNAISGAPTCLGGITFRPSTSIQRIVSAWSDGKVYKEESGNVDNVTLVSGLSFTDPAVFVEGGQIASGENKKVFMFSRNVAPKFLDGDGATMSGITAESIDWSANKPAAAVYHDARIIAYDLDAFPHQYYASSLEDHGDFSITGGGRVFDIAPGQGDRLACLFSHSPGVLYAFKYPFGIYALDTSDFTDYSQYPQLIRADVGMAGPLGICRVANDVFFISSTGRIYSLSALSEGGNPQDADLTAKYNLGEWIRQRVNPSRLKWSRLFYDEIRNELWYTYTSTDGTVNDEALVFDLNEPGLLKVASEDRGEFFNAAFSRISSTSTVEWIVGGGDGLLRRLNSANRSVDATEAYTADVRTPDMDFSFADPSLAGVAKRFDSLEITLVPTGDYDLSIDFVVDGLSKISKTINLGSAGSVFDSGVFDTAIFGGQEVIKHKVTIGAIGNQLAIRLYNSGTNENFQIVNLRVYFKPLGNNYEA